MGERTQILVNVHLSDEKCPFGTVIHYQWGAGITMLLDAISVIRSLPSPYMLKYDDDDEDKFKYLDSILKSQDFEIRNPQVYRNLYKHILNGVQHGSSNEYYDLAQIQDLLKKHPDDSNDREDLLYRLDDSLCARLDAFYLTCDNNDGYMIIDATYSNNHEIDVKLGFGVETNPLADNNERRDTFKFLSFEDFCNQPAYKCSCNEDFQAGYKLLLRSIGCTFMNAEDQNRILAIKRQQNLINC
ncbi:hypothetical protein [Lactobacillus kefiranofaciens]|uniref:Uncharacterized protein n=1 Tax=Lactobacillus kefiranofaciens TaxID=267818 RepID=A0AAX3UED9_9LACO|nr:hypothetical protein [Lactobacillus kefiranofaciens]AEG41684.1 hypothetical protein WANG_p1081 [Lactobacillus kefiranofaciens subsp. kefiranofaciens]KRM20491.1 hypothetical protein FC93_GL001594 [Lactobacillus kefiranofaciens subsp. kefiranofaciens DSM 5016 = JCM 6985]QFQ68319.1 hypothetical protein LKK75_08010 [Lactobacillus kefiranofaciens subsp. kefiranofaciens]WGO85893.1 hypothetical protein QEJ78_11420 [Lactobacillus kefiranofaciens]WQH36788.1 hypothetical protein U2870_04040 [Lactobac